MRCALWTVSSVAFTSAPAAIRRRAAFTSFSHAAAISRVSSWSWSRSISGSFCEGDGEAVVGGVVGVAEVVAAGRSARSSPDD